MNEFYSKNPTKRRFREIQFTHYLKGFFFYLQNVNKTDEEEYGWEEDMKIINFEFKIVAPAVRKICVQCTNLLFVMSSCAENKRKIVFLKNIVSSTYFG